MTRSALIALTLLVALGCGSGTSTDAGTDAGSDAGSDGGMPDAGPDDAGTGNDGGNTNDGGLVCDGGFFLDGSEDGARPIPASSDGVVGVPSTVTRLAAQYVYPLAPPVPLACLSAVVTGPAAQAVPATLTADAVHPQLVTVTFQPATTGNYHVTMSMLHGDTFENDVAVFDEEPAGLTLPRGCGSMALAHGYLGCDEALYDLDGSVVVALDGGHWLQAGGELLAYQDGLLGFASVSDSGVSFGPSVASPDPQSWSSYAGQLAIGGVAGGELFALDGGTLTALGSLPDGWVDLLSNGSVLNLEINQPLSPFGQLYSANADQLVSWVGLDAHSGGSLGCFAPDAGGGASPSPCGAVFSPQYYQQVNAWRLPRRPLGLTTRGVRLPGTGAMYLPNAWQITDEDDFVWQSSASQTAVWFR